MKVTKNNGRNQNFPPKLRAQVQAHTHTRTAHNIKQLDNEMTAGHSTN